MYIFLYTVQSQIQLHRKNITYTQPLHGTFMCEEQTEHGLVDTKALQMDMESWVQFSGTQKKSVMDYLCDLVKGDGAFDKMTIVIFTQMFHIHIGVIYQDGFWSTSIDNWLTSCQIILAFGGIIVYNDTVMYETFTVNVDIFFLSALGEQYIIKPLGEILLETESKF